MSEEDVIEQGNGCLDLSKEKEKDEIEKAMEEEKVKQESAKEESDQKEQPNEVELVVSYKSGMLSIVGQDLEKIEQKAVQPYQNATAIDFSYNSLTDLSSISNFSKLTRLVLDNNALSSLSSISQPIPSVEVCSLNNNSFSDINELIEQILLLFPKLKHLSLLRNPCCPSEMFGGNHDDYVIYRYVVIAKLPCLQYLDTQKISEFERSEALKRAQFLTIAKPLQQQAAVIEPQISERSALPQIDSFAGHAGVSVFGRTSYIYHGKQSEGNRFIRNDDL